jgi:hypothetical protein
MFRRLTPDIENAINAELTRLGYLPDTDFEALELLMSEMDAGRDTARVQPFFVSLDPRVSRRSLL